MCFQKGYNWNDLDYRKKRGCTIEKVQKTISNGGVEFLRGKWESIETPMTFNEEFFKDKI